MGYNENGCSGEAATLQVKISAESFETAPRGLCGEASGKTATQPEGIIGLPLSVLVGQSFPTSLSLSPILNNLSIPAFSLFSLFT